MAASYTPREFNLEDLTPDLSEDTTAAIYAAEEASISKVTVFFSQTRTQIMSELAALRNRTRNKNPLRCRTHSYRLHENSVSGAYSIVRSSNKDLKAKEEQVLDLALVEEIFGSQKVANLKISPDEMRIAFTVGGQMAKAELAIITIGGKSPIIRGPQNVHSFEWGEDSSHIYYTHSENMLANALYLYDMNNHATEMLAEERDRAGSITINRSSDGKYLLIKSGRPLKPVWHLLEMNNQQIIPLQFSSDEIIVDIDRPSSDFYAVGYYTNGEPLLYRFGLSEDSQAMHKVELEWPKLAAFPEKLLSFSAAPLFINRSEFGEQAAVLDKKSGKVSPLIGQTEGGYTQFQSSCNREVSSMQVTRSSIIAPAISFNATLGTGVLRETGKESIPVELQYNPAEYELNNLAAISVDGTDIPMQVAKRIGTTPAGYLLVAYGAYGTPLKAEFNERYLPLLKRDFAVALCHVRGGGERGLN